MEFRGNLEIEIYSGDAENWDRILSSSETYTVFQSYRYGEFKSAHGIEVIRLVYREQNTKQIKALAQCFIKNKFGFKVIGIPRGPVFLDIEKSFVEEILKNTKNFFKEMEKVIVVKMSPNIAYEILPEWETMCQKLGINFTKLRSIHQRTIRVDVSLDLEEIWKKFEGRTRNAIRKAEKNCSYIVKNTVDENDILNFYKIFVETSKRGEFSIHKIEYYKDLVINYSDIAELFVIYINNEIGAGAIILKFGKKAWYLVGATNVELKKCQPGLLLHYNIIKYLHKQGYKEYDLQGIPINPSKDSPTYGVYLFKRGFGGKDVLLVPEVDIVLNPLWHLYVNFQLNKPKIGNILKWIIR